jgi:hypothetical protein
MLRLTVQAGGCVSLTPSNFHAAWTVRAGPSGGIEREFAQPVGDRLLHLGLIERTPDSAPVGYRDFSVPFVLRRFVPTENALKRDAMWEGQRRRRTVPSAGLRASIGKASGRQARRALALEDAL